MARTPIPPIVEDPRSFPTVLRALKERVEGLSIIQSTPGVAGARGPAGATGPAGPAGVMGPAGPTSIGETYVFTQATPASTWVIAHMLGQFPSVQVVDSAGSMVEGDVLYVSSDQIDVSFSGAFSGVAYLN